MEELKKSGRNDVHISYTLEEDEFRDYANNQALFLTRFIHRRFWQIVKARNYKTVRLVGFFKTIQYIRQPIFFEFLSDIKLRFPKTWGILKKIKDYFK